MRKIKRFKHLYFPSAWGLVGLLFAWTAVAVFCVFIGALHGTTSLLLGRLVSLAKWFLAGALAMLIAVLVTKLISGRPPNNVHKQKQ